MKTVGEILLLIGKSSTPGEFRVQTVGIEGKAYSQRISPPKEWGGLRAADLEKITGIQDVTFCHKGFFFNYYSILELIFLIN